MQRSAAERSLKNFIAIHSLDPQDAKMVAAMRTMISANKGLPMGIEARGPYNALFERILPREDVTFETDTLGGIPGVWVYPSDWRSEEAILHLHGGWFNFGTAWAYRHLVGHIAARAKARAFIPDYRLAPEHPFPAAVDDALSCYQGLGERGIRQVVLTGDSAGGNLALVLASCIAGEPISAGTKLEGVVALSPVTDLTLSGSTYETRADADPLFTRPQVANLVDSYLRGADAKHPFASPLYARLSGMPPIRIHAGDDEVLLADSERYIECAVAAGVNARLDVWIGMSHGFVGSVGKLLASKQALDAIGEFLADMLRPGAANKVDVRKPL